MAKVIAIEGRDRLGKSTQAKLVFDHIFNDPRWFNVKYVSVPTFYGVGYNLIYKMLHSGSAGKFNNAFQLLQTVNKLTFQQGEFEQLKRKCDYIILDRWELSTKVYGEASGANSALINFCCSLLYKPDITIVLHGEPFERQEKKDCYEVDDNFQNKVQTLYEKYAIQNLNSTALVSANGTQQEVLSRILEELDSYDIYH